MIEPDFSVYALIVKESDTTSIIEFCRPQPHYTFAFSQLEILKCPGQIDVSLFLLPIRCW